MPLEDQMIDVLAMLKKRAASYRETSRRTTEYAVTIERDIAEAEKIVRDLRDHGASEEQVSEALHARFRKRVRRSHAELCNPRHPLHVERTVYHHIPACWIGIDDLMMACTKRRCEAGAVRKALVKLSGEGLIEASLEKGVASYRRLSYDEQRDLKEGR
jgi:hypothetical protein